MPGGIPPYNRQKGRGKGCRGRRPRRPAAWGAFCAGEARERSLPIRTDSPGTGEVARSARRGAVAAEQAGRVQPVDGGHSKVGGRACPAPTDCRESLCTRGAREGGSPPLPSWRVVDREWAATQGPSESPSHLTVTAPFDKGASLAPCGGSGELPTQKWRKGRGR